MKKIVSICAVILGVCCVILAVILFWSNQRDEQVAQTESQKVVAELEESILELQADAPTEEQSFTTEQETVAEPPSLSVGDGVYLGVLTIPSLDLKLPVDNHWSYAKLLYTPCVYLGSLAQDNLIIAAHNYEAHFSKLHEMNMGEEVTILDGAGTLHTYVLIAQEIIDETDLTGLEAGEWDMTLFTCVYGDNTKRVVLRFQEIEIDG